MEASCPASRKRKRRDEQSDETTDVQGTETPNSTTSREGRKSVEGKIPYAISRWKEEHIQSLSIIVQYEENTTPSELLANYRLRRPSDCDTHLCTYIDKIEEYFLKCCHFHENLDDEFTSLSRKKAEFLRNPMYYSADEFLTFHFQHSVLDDVNVHYWFRRLETAGVRFAECLYFTVLQRDLDVRFDDDGKEKDPLTEYDFQFLFDAFTSMFGLRSFKWFAPCIGTSTLKLPKCEATGNADIIYYQDIAHTVDRPLETLKNVVAICEVKRNFDTTEEHGSIVLQQHELSEASSSFIQNRSLPTHISLAQIGQHGGELLLYSQQSVTEDVIFGIIVQETKVSFTALKITESQYNGIISGKHEKTRPTLIITKPYDFMKKEDRKYLIKPLLQLAMIQEKKLVF